MKLLMVGLGLVAFAGAAMALPLLGPARQPSLPSDNFVSPSQRPERAPPQLSANEAARQAQAQSGGGKVLSVEETDDGWRVKLLKDGTVHFVSVP